MITEICPNVRLVDCIIATAEVSVYAKIFDSYQDGLKHAPNGQKAL